MIKKWIKTAKQIGLFRNRNYNFFLAAVLTYDDENGIIIASLGGETSGKDHAVGYNPCAGFRRRRAVVVCDGLSA